MFFQLIYLPKEKLLKVSYYKIKTVFEELKSNFDKNVLTI